MRERLSFVDIIFGILSTFPVLGIIFYIMWFKSRPKRANLCALFAIIGLVIGLFTTYIGMFNFKMRG